MPQSSDDDLMEAVLGAIAPELVKLQKRVQALEDRPLLADGGTWTNGKLYSVGDVVTFESTTWVCKEQHVSNAAFDHNCFRLQAKSARR